jgi:N-acetyl-anhydromuramyl-L-alanine amidase AmpD
MQQIQINRIRNFSKIIFIAAFILLPVFVCLPAGKALAINDVQISDNTNFELNTYDTATLTTIVASSGGQVTYFDVEPNYVDITLDNLSTVIFTTTAGGQYLKIIKQSGSDNYTVSPSCPTTTVTLTGTGAVVVLRLEVLTTDSCSTPAPPSGGGGGGGTVTPSVNGACGIANNGSFYYSVPTINLCSAGSPSAVSGTGPWTWTCSGLYGGSTSSKCTANKAVSLPAGCISNLGYSATTGLPCSGTKIPVLPPATPTTPTPVAPNTCAPYLTKSIQLGAVNDPTEVKKLQIFLEDYEGFSNLTETGIYDQTTYNAVLSFQAKYAQDILIPWGASVPTGYVYTTTIKKVNEIYCKGVQIPTPVIPVTPTTPAKPTTPTTPSTCAPYITKSIQFGAANDSAEVIKLQKFLKDYEGSTALAQTGVYDQATYNAVKAFQSKYASDILIPWGTSTPTGYVYTTTIKEINQIYCKGAVSSIVTPVVPATPAKPVTPVKPTTPAACGPYMSKYIKLGAANDAAEVKKLQAFLKDYEGFSTLAQTGVYDKATFNAVKTFQLKYAKDILTPWGATNPTGYVYSTTIKKINEIYCSQAGLDFRQLQF